MKLSPIIRYVYHRGDVLALYALRPRWDGRCYGPSAGSIQCRVVDCAAYREGGLYTVDGELLEVRGVLPEPAIGDVVRARDGSIGRLVHQDTDGTWWARMSAGGTRQVRDPEVVR